MIIVLSLSVVVAAAADPSPMQKISPAQRQEQVYGSQLTTAKERAEYHAAMRAAKTPEKRAILRKEHRLRMDARAKTRGVTLSNDPLVRGEGANRGNHR
jgi:Spy/CpxP family protein refolding chaperone